MYPGRPPTQVPYVIKFPRSIIEGPIQKDWQDSVFVYLPANCQTYLGRHARPRDYAKLQVKLLDHHLMQLQERL